MTPVCGVLLIIWD